MRPRGANKKGAKKGGRRPGSRDVVIKLADVHAVINKEAGEAQWSSEAKQNSIPVAVWGFRSPPDVIGSYLIMLISNNGEPDLPVMVRSWPNIAKIVAHFGKEVRTIYKANQVV